MKAIFSCAAAFLTVATVTTADAKGCLKGAVVGGTAGHFAGHHAILGAAAGCVIGRHQAEALALVRELGSKAQAPRASAAASREGARS